MTEKLSIYAKNPLYQALFVFIGSFIMQIFFAAADASSESFNKLNYWIMAGSFLLLFAVANAAGLLQTTNVLKYWSRSVYAYLSLIVLSCLCAYAFSSMGINQAASIKWIFLIISMCYALFFIIVYMMRKILHFAQRNDLENG